MYSSGQTVEKTGVKYELLDCLGEFRRASNGARVFKSNNEKGFVYYEIWKSLNLNDGKFYNLKLPIYIYQDSSDEHVDSNRLDTIDDTNEVTSLLDQYECWFEGKRNNKNFHLDLINQKHLEQCKRLKQLDDLNLKPAFAEGVRIKIIQKENPNSLTKRKYEEWVQKYPDFHIKLVDYVYKNDDSVYTDICKFFSKS